MDFSEKVFTKENSTKSIEAQANSQENESLLLFSRLHNPVIKNQILDLMTRAEQNEAQLPDIKPVYDEYGNPVITSDGKLATEEIKNTDKPRTIVEIEKQYDWILSKIEAETPISFKKGFPSCGSFNGLGREKVNINFSVTASGEKVTPRQQSMIEAHEKGHAIRRYHEKGYTYLKNYFLQAVDLSKINVTEEDLEATRQIIILNSPPDQIDEIRKQKTNMTNYKKYTLEYLSSPHEIAERMSQLKNYFGFKGTEKFTVEHLRYAKEHYIQDIGFDNEMKNFFEAIPREKEEKFCEILNNSGI